MKHWLRNWMSRHQHGVSLTLHIAGIPACFIAAPVLLFMGMWCWAIAAFVGGYALQFVGHHVEGNRSGEEVLFRKLLRRNSKQNHPDKP